MTEEGHRRVVFQEGVFDSFSQQARIIDKEAAWFGFDVLKYRFKSDGKICCAVVEQMRMNIDPEHIVGKRCWRNIEMDKSTMCFC